MPLQVTLINHACVKIAIGDAVILCDPWLSGPAFNNGWDLLIKTPLTLDEVMAGVTHIWVSHEHPDHFVPKFFIDISAAYKSIPVLFQETRDRRVKSFIESRGFDVTELPNRRERTIGGVRVICGVSEFYDSWLHLRDGTHSVLNLNDCAEGDEAELREIAGAHRPDRHAAHAVQLRGLEGRTRQCAVPRGGGAAQARNHCGAGACAEAAPCRAVRELCVFLQRGEFLPQRSHQPSGRRRGGHRRRPAARPRSCFRARRGTRSTPHDNATALASFDKVYGALDALPLRPPGESVPLERLAQEFAKYRERAFQQNSQALIKLLRRLPLLGAFHPVVIRLTDLGTTVSVSIVDGFAAASGPEDVAMHSSSLSFLFNNPFGFDTLTVNGRFEATPEGFGKMTKSLAIGSLNAMGLAVSPRLVMNLKVVLMLLRRLAAVIRNMTQGNRAAQQT